MRFNNENGVDILSLDDKLKTTVESRNPQPAILEVFRRGSHFRFVLSRRNPDDPRLIEGVVPDYEKWPDRKFTGTVEGMENRVFKIKPDPDAPCVYSEPLSEEWLRNSGFLRDEYPHPWVSFRYKQFGNVVVDVVLNNTSMIPKRFTGHCMQIHPDNSVSIVGDDQITTPLRSSPIADEVVLADLRREWRWRKVSFQFHSTTDFTHDRMNVCDVRPVK